MKIITLLCSFGLLFSCTHKKQAVDQKEKNPQHASNPHKKSPEAQKAGAIVLVVKNDTKEKHELSVGWGEHRPFLLYPTKKTAFAQGIAAPIYALDGCSCTRDGNCMKQSKPPTRLIELGPGKTFQYKWDGKIVVWKKSLKEKGAFLCQSSGSPRCSQTSCLHSQA